MGLVNKLKALMAEKNFSQAELARQLNVTRMAVTNWASGNREPDIETIQKIASILGVQPGYFLDDDPNLPIGWIKIPVIGVIAAGAPMEAVEHDGEIMVPASKYDPKIHQAYRVFGESMYPRFQDGDVVLVDVSSKPKDGDVVICRVNGYGEFTLKRFYQTGDTVMLKPDNNDPKYKPLMFSISKMNLGEQEDIHVIGKAVMLLATKL